MNFIMTSVLTLWDWNAFSMSLSQFTSTKLENCSIFFLDWTIRENVQAKLKVMVKRILRKWRYPPDKREKATQTVLEQAKLLGYEWMS